MPQQENTIIRYDLIEGFKKNAGVTNPDDCLMVFAGCIGFEKPDVPDQEKTISTEAFKILINEMVEHKHVGKTTIQLYENPNNKKFVNAWFEELKPFLTPLLEKNSIILHRIETDKPEDTWREARRNQWDKRNTLYQDYREKTDRQKDIKSNEFYDVSHYLGEKPYQNATPEIKDSVSKHFQVEAVDMALYAQEKDAPTPTCAVVIHAKNDLGKTISDLINNGITEMGLEKVSLKELSFSEKKLKNILQQPKQQSEQQPHDKAHASRMAGDSAQLNTFVELLRKIEQDRQLLALFETHAVQVGEALDGFINRNTTNNKNQTVNHAKLINEQRKRENFLSQSPSSPTISAHANSLESSLPTEKVGGVRGYGHSYRGGRGRH